MRYVCLAAALLMLSSCAFAADIVTMPTANQMKAGEVDLAAYYIGVDNPPVAPQFIQYQTLYVGLTDKLEIDAHRSAVDKSETATIFVASYKLLSENQTQPDLVVGVRNLFGTATTTNPPGAPVDFRDKSKDQSYFVAAAKTFFFNPMKPGPPLVRVHLGLGTKDWTLFNEKRHDGLFGGLQFLLRPDIGAVIEHDGQDLITGLTYMPVGTGLTLKGGGFGDHWWVGIAYNKVLGF